MITVTWQGGAEEEYESVNDVVEALKKEYEEVVIFWNGNTPGFSIRCNDKILGHIRLEDDDEPGVAAMAVQ